MTIIMLLLTAEQPLLLTSLQGDPNSSVSFPYIPGSVLRGALIGRYIQQKRILDGCLELSDATVQSLFFDHHTRYLNAYLYAGEHNTPHRLLPVPRAWRKEKHDEWESNQLQATDSAFASYTSLDEPKPVSGDGCWIDTSGRVMVATVQRHINIHNLRDRERGRGVEGSGAVFRYEAIAPGQLFQAAIICDAATNVLLELQALLDPGTLWLGGSRSAGYGRVALHDIATASMWYETGTDATQRVNTGKQEMRLTLLSDLITRDPATGQYDATLPLSNLADKLDIKNVKVNSKRSFQSATRAGGFNRTWGLPLPQSVALAAGSVFTITFDGALDPQRVVAFEHEGLGERRAEGFGRIAINWQPLNSTPMLQKLDLVTAATTLKPLQASSQKIADQMAQRILRRRMDLRLDDLAGRTRITGTISNTQLTRLRIVARRGMEQGDLRKVEALLSSLPKNARDQFAQAEVEDGDDTVSLQEWLDRQLGKPNKNWVDFVQSVALYQEMSPILPDDTLAREYTLRLIMAVARQAVKEER